MAAELVEVAELGQTPRVRPYRPCSASTYSFDTATFSVCAILGTCSASSRA